MSTLTDICSKPSCKNYVSDDDLNIQGVKYKKCKPCQAKDTANTAEQQKWKCEGETPVSEQGPSVWTRPAPNNIDKNIPGWSNGASSEEEPSKVRHIIKYKYIYLPVI